MAKVSWGLKRQCPSCSNRYYDLGKNPATCPKCSFVHDINAPVKTRRGRRVVIETDDDPLVIEKVKGDAKTKAAHTTKPIKEIEGVDLDEFEDIETGDDEVEEIEEIDDDIETIEEIEEIEDEDEKMDDDIVLEEDSVGETLIDEVEEGGEEEDEDEDDDKKPAKSSKSSKLKAKPKGKLRETPKPKPAAKSARPVAKPAGKAKMKPKPAKAKRR